MRRPNSALKRRHRPKRQVILKGEVCAADLENRRFSLRLEDGTKIVAQYPLEHEHTITEALCEHETRRLQLTASVELADNGKIKRIDSVQSVRVEPFRSAAPAPSKPFWEVALDIGSRVPEDQWAKVPSDLAKNLHHYLYGSPKENN